MSEPQINKPANRISRLLQIRHVVKKYGLYDLIAPLKLPTSAKFFAGMVLGRAQNTSQPIGQRIRPVSYTHLTLPTKA